MRTRQQKHLYAIVFVGMMAALVFVCNYIKITIPSLVGETRLKIANAICLLCGMMFGGVYGGLASGIGTCLYDLLNGYASSALYSFFAFFVMAAVCGVFSHWHGAKGLDMRKNATGAVAGALTYYVIYCVRTIFVKGMFERGFSFSVAVASSSANMLTSFVNVIIAVGVSCLIVRPVIRALRSANLLQRME